MAFLARLSVCSFQPALHDKLNEDGLVAGKTVFIALVEGNVS